MNPNPSLWRLIAAFFLLPALVHAQALVQVPSKRSITGAPPLFESQPDREIPGRFVGHTASGCALSFAAPSIRGLSWSGACTSGRMQGQGTLIGYDYEQQPTFIFEGNIDRGLRASGVMYENDRKDGVLIGWRTAIIGSALQPRTEVRFLDMPRPFLLALDDWSRQTDGKDLLASMGATWAPSSQPSASAANDDQGVRQGLGILLGTIGQYQQAKQGRLQSGGGIGASDSFTSDGSTGEISLVALSPPGNARSRNECLKMEWITSPLARNKANSLSLIDPQLFGTSSDGRNMQQKYLVAYSTCAESLNVTVFACVQEHMTSSGSYERNIWGAGEHIGTNFGTAHARAGLGTDVRLAVAHSSVRKGNYGDGHSTRVVRVFYGAWPSSDFLDAEGNRSASNMSLDRKIVALNRKSNEILGLSSETSTLFYNQGRSAQFPNQNWRKLGVKTCSAFNADEVWNATR